MHDRQDSRFRPIYVELGRSLRRVHQIGQNLVKLDVHDSCSGRRDLRMDHALEDVIVQDLGR